MKKENIVNLLITLSLIFAFSVFFVCSAEDVNKGEYLVNKEQVTYADEFAEVKETINIYSNISPGILDSFKDDTFILESAYRSFFTTNPDIISDYNEKGSFENMIEDNYLWQIPTSSGGLVTVQKENNICEIIGARFPPEVSTNQKHHRDMDKKAIADIINTNEKLANAIDLKFVVCNMYYMSFAYIKTDSDEFLIPFGTSLDSKGLENGKLYTAKELFAILNNNYNLESNGDVAINNNVSVLVNGAETSSTQETLNTQEISNTKLFKYSVIIFVSIAFLLITFFAVILTVKHKKKKFNDKGTEDDKETADCIKTHK